jgi:FkbM family methyltransferase
MTRTLTLNLPGGRQIPFVYPYSPLMEAVCQNILARNEYPPLPFLEAKTIVDVGANIGATAVCFSVQYPQATLYALEPAREAFGFLEQNTASLANVKRFNVGAFDKDTTATLHLGSQASVTNSLVANVMTEGGASETVQLRRLSTFLAEQGIEHISLLKLDTEGAELPILNDILPMLPRIDAIFVEYHSESDRLELDRMLTPTYTLFASRAEHPHRGLMCFVAKGVLAGKTTWDGVKIDRPDI